MFIIEDGRDRFFQWDLDRRLIILDDAKIKEVHFCNKTDDCSLVVETYEEGGRLYANVPNILLQTAWRIKVYAYDDKYTKYCKTFNIEGRTKPADYIYTETEVKSWEELEQKTIQLENDLITAKEQLTNKIDFESIRIDNTNDRASEIEKELAVVKNDIRKNYVVNSMADLMETEAKIGETAILINEQAEYWAKLGNTGTEKGLSLFHPQYDSSDGFNFYTIIGGRDCASIPSVETHPANKRSRYLYFHLEELEYGREEITFKVTYFDRGYDDICIQYNAANGEVAKEVYLINRTNTDKWKEATVTITDANFTHAGALNGCDFRVGDLGTDGMYISDIEIITHTPASVIRKITRKNIYMLNDDNYADLRNWVQIG